MANLLSLSSEPFELPDDRDMLPSERREYVLTHRTSILNERWPVGFLQVYCEATVDTDPDLAVDVMMAVRGRMSGEPLGEDARPFVAEMAAQENRVVVRCRPYSTFATPLHPASPPPRQRPGREDHTLACRLGPLGRQRPDHVVRRAWNEGCR